MNDRVEVREAPAAVEVRTAVRTEVATGGVVGPRGHDGAAGPAGPPGAPGPLGSLRREALSGVDGAHTHFFTSSAFVAGSTVPYLNGLAQSSPEDYVEAPPTGIDMTEPPLVGDTLLITYSEA